MAQLDIAEADKNTVSHGTVPHFRVCKRPKTYLVKIRIHIQQQTAAGHEIYLQYKIVQRSYR